MKNGSIWAQREERDKVRAEKRKEANHLNSKARPAHHAAERGKKSRSRRKTERLEVLLLSRGEGLERSRSVQLAGG